MDSGGIQAATFNSAVFSYKKLFNLFFPIQLWLYSLLQVLIWLRFCC